MFKLIAVLSATAGFAIPAPAAAHNLHHIRHHKPHHVHHVRRHKKHSVFTGVIVAGRISTFGPPTEGSGITADGGSDNRPCIATRDSSARDHWFLVTVGRHHAKLLDCDWGPAAWTGRNIDITGYGAEKLHINPFSFPTDTYGTAKELK